MRAEAEYLDQIGEIDVNLMSGKRQADVFSDRAPGQQARFLEHNPETPGSRCTQFAAKIQIESGRDLQDRRLAAAGGANQRRERSGVEPKFEVANDLDWRTIGRQVALRIDAKLKRIGVSSDLRVVQVAAPEGFQSAA